jgi:hypothetical protein
MVEAPQEERSQFSKIVIPGEVNAALDAAGTESRDLSFHKRELGEITLPEE